MNEKALRELVRNCLKDYYEEDKIILIDYSLAQITCITFFLYNLIFFGNKVYVFRETLKILEKISKQEDDTTTAKIKCRNAKYILDAMQKDKKSGYNNYNVIEMKQYGNDKSEAVKNFLIKNPNAIFYLCNYKLYQELRETEVRSQIYLLSKGFKETDPFANKEFKFETIGAIKFEDKKMMIHKREGALIKIFNQKGIEKTGEVEEVKPRDFVLIRSIKEEVYSFLLYQIVSRHSRNQAIRIVWVNLKIGQKSNKFIDRLPYMYRKMLLDNVN